jgi:hypothetical protein
MSSIAAKYECTVCQQKFARCVSHCLTQTKKIAKASKPTKPAAALDEYKENFEPNEDV